MNFSNFYHRLINALDKLESSLSSLNQTPGFSRSDGKKKVAERRKSHKKDEEKCYINKSIDHSYIAPITDTMASQVAQPLFEIQ